METTRLLYVEKKPMPHWLIIWIFALPMLWGVLFHLLALPDFVKYTADVAWVCLLFFMLSGSRIQVEKKIVPLEYQMFFRVQQDTFHADETVFRAAAGQIVADLFDLIE